MLYVAVVHLIKLSKIKEPQINMYLKKRKKKIIDGGISGAQQRKNKRIEAKYAFKYSIAYDRLHENAIFSFSIFKGLYILPEIIIFKAVSIIFIDLVEKKHENYGKKCLGHYFSLKYL